MFTKPWLIAALSIVFIVACGEANITGREKAQSTSSQPSTGGADSASDGTGDSNSTPDSADASQNPSDSSTGGDPDTSSADISSIDPNTLALTDWMGRLYASRPETKLKDIVFPGTHNSATYKITPSSPAGPGKAGIYGLPGVSKVAAVWSKCQNQSVAAQLAAGSRFFDLRLADHNGAIRIYHGLESLPLNEVLAEFKAFTTAHPREIIVIKAKTYNEYAETLSASSLAAFEGQIRSAFQNALGERIMPKASDVASLSFSDFWKNNRSLYLPEIGGELAEGWPETEKVNEVISKNEQTLRQQDGRKWQEVQLILTPGTSTIIKSAVLGTNSGGLPAFQADLLKQVPAILQRFEDAALKPSFFIIDFFEVAKVMPTVLRINHARLTSKAKDGG